MELIKNQSDFDNQKENHSFLQIKNLSMATESENNSNVLKK